MTRSVTQPTDDLNHEDVAGMIQIPTGGVLATLPSEIREWLGTDEGRKALLSVLGTVFLAVTTFASRLLYSRFLSLKWYQGSYGEFFLYHPPLIPGINDLPRISKLIMSHGILSPGRAKQMNVAPRHTVHRGWFRKVNNVFYFQMISRNDECPKTIVLWDFHIRKCSRDRIALGTMCSTNYRHEPYHAPIILSESRLPRATVESALATMMAAPAITFDTRRRLMEMLDQCGVGTPDEEFEHITSRTGPVGRDVPMFAWISGRLRGVVGLKMAAIGSEAAEATDAGITASSEPPAKPEP